VKERPQVPAPRMATKDEVSIPSFEIKVTNNNTFKPKYYIG
jgi:hypothetical protein